MSIECGYCERDLRGPHDEDCPRIGPKAEMPLRLIAEAVRGALRVSSLRRATPDGPGLSRDEIRETLRIVRRTAETGLRRKLRATHPEPSPGRGKK